MSTAPSREGPLPDRPIGRSSGLGGAWLAAARRDVVTRDAAAIWVASRVAVVLAAVGGSFERLYPRTSVPPVSALFMQWDARHLHEIAQFGYFHQTHQYGHCCLAGFFPGQPLLVRLLHGLGLGWYVAPLVLSAALGLVGVIALARLAALELPDASPHDRLQLGRRAVLYLVCAPYAVFFFAGYTEAPFLGFALAGWLAARHGRWGWAALGVGAAALIRVTGLFLAAGLVVEYVTARRRAGLPLLRPAALWLAAPFATGGGYLLWLYAKTGDPNAWSNAQRGWGRGYGDPLTALRNSWHMATNPGLGADLSLAWKAEIAAVGLGVVLTGLLLTRRRFGEAVYVGLGVASFLVSSVYYTAPRAAMLWFPLWLLLARATLRRPWLHGAVLAVSAPLMVVLLIGFTTPVWVN